MNVEGKAAIITGGGTGVGRATALRLAELGCSVLVNYSRSKSEAEETAAQARKRGAPAIAFQADVSDDSACRAMVAEALRAFGQLDILVNNAGTTTFIPHAELERVEESDWDRILAVNLKGPFFCTRAAKPALEAAGSGEVVMTSSVAGLVGTGSSIPYCVSKAALNTLTVTLARVLAPKIRVNAVAPGFIAGNWLREGLGPAYEPIKRGIEGKAVLQRVCEADDVAEAIVGLICGSDMVTGHVLPVEGGMLIGG
ncbi:MAG: SDR family NAD(P)-dependent oxidoreductase [Myxococcota bacterium]